jgi:Tol biopolymer transport system component/DNA-binding winged helix-turn-helix (wHTH) protein
VTQLSPLAADRAYAFGPFIVDGPRRLLWRDGQFVPLTPRAFDILLLLIEHRGEVVDKDTLLSAIWGSTVVEEATVVRHVSTLRKALHLLPEQHDVLVTVPGRGYRFVAPIAEVEQVPEALPTGPVDRSSAGPLDRSSERPPSTLARFPDRRPRTTDRGPMTVGPQREWPVGAWGAAGAVAAAAVALVLGVRGPVTSAPRAATPSAVPLELRQLTFESGVPRHPTWSPDGLRVAFTSDRAGNPDIWVQGLQDAHPVRLTSSPEADWEPDWSPDGDSVVFRSERDGGGLYTVPALGGAERRISSFGYHPRWSSDGSWILFGNSRLRTSATERLYVIHRDDTTPRAVLTDLTKDFSNLSAAWHPDGRRVSMWGRRDGIWTFLTTPIAGGAPVPSRMPDDVRQWLESRRVTLGRFVWSRGGRHLYFEGLSGTVGNLWRVPVDPTSLAWTGMPERLTTAAARESDMALSPDGHLAFRSRDEQTRLWSFPLERRGLTAGESAELITPGDSRERQPSASMGRDWLVYQAVRGGYRELRALSLVDRRERLIASGTDRIDKAVMSSDGTRLAYLRRSTAAAPFASASPARAEFVVVHWNGKSDADYAVTADSQSGLTPFDWSPDGRTILGSCRAGTAALAVCSMDVSGDSRQPVIVTSDPALRLFQAHFSPDGRWIVFMAVDPKEAGLSRLYVVPASGGDWIPITDGQAFDDKPRWSKDGRIVYFLSNRDGFFNVWGRRFSASAGGPQKEPFRVTTFRGDGRMISPENISEVEIAVAGNRLVVPLTDVSSQIWLLENVDR